MNKKYYELQLKINPDMEDIISEICFEVLPCEGVVLAEETYKDLEMVSTTEGTLRIFLNFESYTLPSTDGRGKNLLMNSSEFTNSGEGLIRTFIENTLTEQRNIFKARGLTDEELGSWEFTIQEKENEDWSKKWKEKWDVTHVTDRITVVPDWLSYEPKQDNEVIIRLEPGCAFGTGTHQTTQLCMRAMEKYLKPNMTVADIGMGSGILSICAIKMGAKSTYGCDIDETVINVAKENAIKNGISLLCHSELVSESDGEQLLKQVQHNNRCCYFELGTADKINQKFDFVMANILHNVLFDIMGDLKNLLNENGILSLSGILNEKRDIVLEAIEREHLNIIEEMHQDQWVGFVVKKKG